MPGGMRITSKIKRRIRIKKKETNMPIYEYRCRKCSHAFEKLVSRSDSPSGDCPKCGAPKPEKQLSTFSASMASASAMPCASGACPTPSACGGGGCSSGTCPYSN